MIETYFVLVLYIQGYRAAGMTEVGPFMTEERCIQEHEKLSSKIKYVKEFGFCVEVDKLEN